LDLAEQIVLPAFFDPTLRRKFGDTVYLFLHTGWFTVPAQDGFGPEVCIYGQIVKDTLLSREQILAGGELIESHDSIASAPSAFFVFMLSNHKLVYVPETSGAPSLEVFGSTLQNFLRSRHASYIHAEFLRRKDTLTATTKLALLEEVPAPTVEVMPLATRESIEQFVSSIEKLTHLEFRLLDTNREFQMRGPYQKIREDKQALGAKTSKLIYDNPEGMSKDEVTNQIEISASTGNQAVVVAGVSADGTKVRGNNDKFRMLIPATDLPDAPRDKSFRLLERFREHAVNGSISLDLSEDTGNRIRQISTNLSEGANGEPRG
jgi:hypothetical protein